VWPPRVLVAPDSFKGSLDQAEAAAAIAAGVRRAVPGAVVRELPLSDGGEGWLDTLVAADMGARTGPDTVAGEPPGAAPRGPIETVPVAGPLGEPLDGRFGLIEGGRTAVIEVASASGLALVDPSPATFRTASSAGTGALIAGALDAGARRILVGLGGSATTDGGAGLAVALGARLLDGDARPVGGGTGRGTAPGASLAGDEHESPAPGNAVLADVVSVDLSGLDPRLADVEVLAATDVDNPLLGPTGAAAVYGPQKGARPEDVASADAALANFADRVEAATGGRLRDLPGAGAAGGLGFGLLAFCGARVVSGIELALDLVHFDAALADVDLVITGEGRVDLQTLRGKVVAGVAGRARAAGVPAYAIGGAVDPAVIADWAAFAAAGLAGVESTIDDAVPPAAADLPPPGVALDPQRAGERLTRAAERLMHVLLASG
jgi:glycerate 2-kinase